MATPTYKRATTSENVLVHATTRKLGVRRILCGAGRIQLTLQGEFDLDLIRALACPSCVEIIEARRSGPAAASPQAVGSVSIPQQQRGRSHSASPVVESPTMNQLPAAVDSSV